VLHALRFFLHALMGCGGADCDMSAESLAVLATQGVAKSSSLSMLDLSCKTGVCEGGCMVRGNSCGAADVSAWVQGGRRQGAGRSSARPCSCLSSAIVHWGGGEREGDTWKDRRCGEHDVACRPAVACCACFGMCVRQIYKY